MSSDNEDDQFDQSAPPPFREDEAESSEELGEASDAVDGFSRAPLAPVERRSSNRQLWLISYSDFMTILMIFFLAMYGYTYLAKMSLLKAQKNQINYAEFAGRVQDMQKKIGGQIKVQDNVDKVIVQLSDKVLFPSGSAVLSPESVSTLEELAKSIKLIEGEVIVQGHTDNVPVRSARIKSNWELSSARAFSVIAALTQQGVPPERLAAWGFGENRPLAENTTAEGRAENRRIEVVILKKKPKSEDKHGV